MFWEHALRIASQIHDPVPVAAIAAVLAIIGFIVALRKRLVSKLPLIILASAVIILGLAPLAASTFLKSRGVYRLRVVVLDQDKLPIEDADVNSSSGGEPKRVQGGWEFDIPMQTIPHDGKELVFASARSSFLAGSSTVRLADDYYPTTTIQLVPDTSAMVRGVVEDERGRSVVGAVVSIVGYHDTFQTDEMGNFVLPAHAAVGQVVQLRAEKNGLIGKLSVPAGQSVEVIVKRP